MTLDSFPEVKKRFKMTHWKSTSHSGDQQPKMTNANTRSSKITELKRQRKVSVGHLGKRDDP